MSQVVVFTIPTLDRVMQAPGHDLVVRGGGGRTGP